MTELDLAPDTIPCREPTLQFTAEWDRTLNAAMAGAQRKERRREGRKEERVQDSFFLNIRS